MGKKKRAKKKELRLEKKLRKLAAGNGGDDEHAAGPDAAASFAIAPAELQLGGGEPISTVVEDEPPNGGAPRADPNASRPRAIEEAGRFDATPLSDGSRPDTPVSRSRPAFDLFDAIQERRSHKRFVQKPVARRALEVMLEAAVLAPNHKMTEPWRFVVFGEEARRRYGEIRARAKLGRGGRDEKRERIIESALEIPSLIAVLCRASDDAVRREEDYAATFMAVQNLLLAGTALGLGTKIITGRMLDERRLRALVEAEHDERIVALIHVGEPAESRKAKKRTPASARTTWLP